MKGIVFTIAIIIFVPSVLTGGFGASINTSLTVVAVILGALAIMSAMKGN